jgi:hypothetical protein
MAQMLVCDLCQDVAIGTFLFGLGRLDNEMDLCEAHHAELADIVREWAEFARRPGKPPAIVTTRAKPPNAFTSTGPPWWLGKDKKQLRTDMREWARDNGWPDLGDMGRIPADLAAAYAQANKDTQRHRVTEESDDADDDATEDSPESEDQPALISKPSKAKRPLASVAAKRGA